MKHFYLFTALIVFALACQTKKQPSMEEKQKALRDKIVQQFDSIPGDFALAFVSIDQPEHKILINEKEEFHAASTMKTPVLIEVYKQAKEGKFSLDDSVAVINEFKSIVDSSTFSLDISEDGGENLYQHVDKKRLLKDLVYDMIIYSSNLATNIVIEMVNAKNVTQTMRELGAEDINVLRGVQDIKAYRKGMSNTTTAYDLMVIYRKLANKEVVSENASEAMLDILFDQTHNNIIPAKLPEDVKVAHKTGSISGVRHDSGIVYLPDGRKYVMVILSKNMEDEEAGIKMMADVSKWIYDFVIENKTKK